MAAETVIISLTPLHFSHDCLLLAFSLKSLNCMSSLSRNHGINIKLEMTWLTFTASIISWDLMNTYNYSARKTGYPNSKMPIAAFPSAKHPDGGKIFINLCSLKQFSFVQDHDCSIASCNSISWSWKRWNDWMIALTVVSKWGYDWYLSYVIHVSWIDLASIHVMKLPVVLHTTGESSDTCVLILCFLYTSISNVYKTFNKYKKEM